MYRPWALTTISRSHTFPEGRRCVMSTLPDHKSVKVPPKTATVLRPSASVLLISPINQVLLLHRVKKASSFASAHVFPGGALSSIQDGSIPPPTSPAHHQDSPAYRLAAIRETFEECGILLATSKKTGQLFTEISDAERDQGRRAVHAGQIHFRDLLEQWGAVPDVQGLLPFTRWITPPSMPKRFSTQMYLYFLPPCSSSSALPGCPGADADGAVLPTPTHDGGIEHTAARFLAPATWLRLASNNEVLLFPPQFFLLYLLSLYLGTPTNDNNNNTTTTTTTTTLQRSALLSFLHAQRSYSDTPEPAWADACISPIALRKSAYGQAGQDGGSGGDSGGSGGSGSSGGSGGSGRGIDRNTTVLDLSSAGLEIEALGAGRKGVRDWLLTAKFGSEGPREMAVWKRDEVLLVLRGEERVRGAL